MATFPWLLKVYLFMSTEWRVSAMRLILRKPLELITIIIVIIIVIFSSQTNLQLSNSVNVVE